ncbi:MAG: hypothetical protein GX138_00420 [Firmicutes bacterium]|jgi:Na+/phosphate symporter|nr:hypothetical protein [Bacillota bacterium]
MNMMGSALERAAGSKMKKMVEALTSNRFKEVLVGMLVTMFILFYQSNCQSCRICDSSRRG